MLAVSLVALKFEQTPADCWGLIARGCVTGGVPIRGAY